MQQVADRIKFKDVEALNKCLDSHAQRGWKIIVAIPVGDRPSLMGDFELLMIWRKDCSA